MADPVRRLLGIYYPALAKSGVLFIRREVFWSETSYLRNRGWIRAVRMDPEPGNDDVPPVFRISLTRLGEREGRLAASK